MQANRRDERPDVRTSVRRFDWRGLDRERFVVTFISRPRFFLCPKTALLDVLVFAQDCERRGWA